MWTGVAENMMSGKIKGNASQSAGATAHGTNKTSSRCGISMKGIDIIVKGSVASIYGSVWKSSCFW